MPLESEEKVFFLFMSVTDKKNKDLNLDFLHSLVNIKDAIEI